QAEDGIRDFHVTGVQTCALPILGHEVPMAGNHHEEVDVRRAPRVGHRLDGAKPVAAVLARDVEAEPLEGGVDVARGALATVAVEIGRASCRAGGWSARAAVAVAR